MSGNCAGRGAKVANLYTELTEGIMSYGVTRHRHGGYQSQKLDLDPFFLQIIALTMKQKI